MAAITKWLTIGWALSNEQLWGQRALNWNKWNHFCAHYWNTTSFESFKVQQKNYSKSLPTLLKYNKKKKLFYILFAFSSPDARPDARVHLNKCRIVIIMILIYFTRSKNDTAELDAPPYLLCALVSTLHTLTHFVLTAAKALESNFSQ